MIYSRRGLHGQLTEQLGRRIVSGEVDEGAILDVTAIESEFGVSRTVVRETFRALATKGLLDARPRVGTFVLPRGRWNLLDSDVMRWRADLELSPRLHVELDQLRHLIEPWAAREAALNHDHADLGLMRKHIEEMRKARDDGSLRGESVLEAHIDADVAFHASILAATGNELARSLVVVLDPLLRSRDALIPEGAQNENFLELHVAVVEAIESRDPDRAERAVLELLDEAAADLSSLRGGHG